MTPLFSISIVSHGQAYLIGLLLADLTRLVCQDFEIIITVNIPEDDANFQGFQFPFPLRIIRNATQQGFGANHNAAFLESRGKFFFVVNPDIRISSLDFLELCEPFSSSQVGLVAPVVLSENGVIEDSARRFPTMLRLLNRKLVKRRRPDYQIKAVPFPVDWVAGMFLVFRAEAFRHICGFDDKRFYMYMEDVDICRRLRNKGWEVLVNPGVNVVHKAQRASRKNLKHMCWHVVSVFRYLTGL